MFPFFFQPENADRSAPVRFIKISDISIRAAVIRRCPNNRKGRSETVVHRKKSRMHVEIHMPQDVYIYDPNVPVPENVRHVEIPKGVTVIREDAFKDCSALQSVNIPDSVTEIGNFAFCDCTALQSVTIPDGVTEIGNGAFRECSGLQSVTIPDGVTKIGSYAFYDCSALQSVVIPDGVTKIDLNAFYGCSGLRSVMIPDSVTKISAGAFSGCTDLQSITIPDSVTEISTSAFHGCSGLQSIVIPDGVTKIDLNAFYGCSGLRSVTIPDSVTRIRSFAFFACSGLQSITIPDSVTEIDNYVFEECSGLQSVTIPNSVTKIGNSVFCGCAGLRSVTIPDGVTAIGRNAFKACAALRSIAIPDGVTEIGHNAFEDCSALQSVTIPNSVTKIGNSVFCGCAGLRSVTIPDGVTEIGYNAFEDCSALQSVTIPDSVTGINKYTFYNCRGLQSVIIPDSVTKIGDYAFSGCSALQSVTIPDSVTAIGHSAFEGCSALRSVTIPDSVTEIGKNVFRNCSALQSVTIPDGITEIGYGTFSDCSGLQSVTIPDGVTKIGGSAFWSCSTLRTVTIPDGVTKIGGSAFWSCSTLRTVTIPDSVTEIGDHAFRRCDSLQSITIPDSVTKIGFGVFEGCPGLQSVTIPDGVTEIGNRAFADCPALKSLIYKGVNIAPFINIDGYGVNTFDIIKVLVEHQNPLNENTVRRGIDMAHRGELDQWAADYPVFGTMRFSRAVEYSDKAEKERLRQCFAIQKRTKGRVPEILDQLAMTARICGIPPERLAETFDIEYTKNLLGKIIPLVPATACRCYYDRGICDMLIRKEKISVMAEVISLYNKSGHQECYRCLMDFIRSHPDTRTADLQYAADHAEEIPMRAGTTLTQIRQHRTYMENLAEVTKIEAKYNAVVPEFRLSDYPCSIDPVSITYGGMTARVLDLSDDKDIALAARLGELTNCCQRLDAAGETAMMHGFLNPDAGFWVIEDGNGNIKAQAEIWKTNNGDLVFDNIEFANTDKEHLTDRANRLRGIIAAWATESGYKNIIMGCGYNELGVDSMEQAPIPELRLTPEEVFALQEGNDVYVSFRNMDDVHRYMQDAEYDPNDFVYTDADEQCVYIKKDGIVSDYLMQGCDRIPEAELFPVAASKRQEEEPAFR